MDRTSSNLLVGAYLIAASCQAPQRAPAHELKSAMDMESVAITGQWTSSWIESSTLFDEVLPSWNVDLPEGAAFRVDLSVRSSGETKDSPWLDMGGWGGWPEADRAPHEFNGGAVAVDILRLDDPRSEARLRVRTRGLQAGEVIKLKRLNLCFSSRELQNTREFGPRPSEPFRMDLALRRQADERPELAPRICSPTSVAMVLEHHGASIPTAEVAALLYDAENDIYGNWNRAIQGAWLLGVPGTLIRVQSWDEACSYMAGDRPLVISIGVQPGQLTGAPYESTAGHLLLLCGFDSQGNAWVLDPATPREDLDPKRYSLAELEVVWLERGGFAYLIAPNPSFLDEG
jgi:hypothetical protein